MSNQTNNQDLSQLLRMITTIMVAALAILLVGFELLKGSVGKIMHPQPISFSGLSVGILSCAVLAKHPNIVGIKEASGDMGYAMKVARFVGPDFAMYSGNDDITLPILAAGGSGVISVYANVMPKMCHEIVMDYLNGNHAQALANTLKYLNLMNDLFIEVNPIPVKAAMNMMGLKAGPMRLPLCEMSAEHQATLRKTMEEAGLV